MECAPMRTPGALIARPAPAARRRRLAHKGVLMAPGSKQLTWMLSLPQDAASDLAMGRSAPLELQ